MDPVALAQAGPVAILLVGITTLAAAFVKGTVVPGWLYQAEKAQREKAETAAERNLEILTITVKALNDQRGPVA